MADKNSTSVPAGESEENVAEVPEEEKTPEDEGVVEEEAPEETKEEEGKDDDDVEKGAKDSSKQQAPQKKNSINPRFKDVHQTGKWGGFSKRDIFIIVAIIVAAVVAVVLAVVLTQEDDPTPSPTKAPTPVPTMAPSASPSASPSATPTTSDNREIEGLDNMRSASNGCCLPSNPEDLIGAKNRTNSTPQELAAEWILYDDAINIPARSPVFLPRYALAVLFYNNGGNDGNWNEKGHWLDGSYCDWFGIDCDLIDADVVVGVELKGNNLTGTFPFELSSLTNIRNLDLSDNMMSGQLPGDAIGTMTKLFQIALTNNNFGGTFPDKAFLAASSLDTMFISENAMTGVLDPGFCFYSRIILDCDDIDISQLQTQQVCPVLSFLECNSSPTSSPSEAPTVSQMPSVSSVPSATPTVSLQPSDFPSTMPTISVKPSNAPSISGAPTNVPSMVPSDTPSVSGAPTLTSSPSMISSDAPSGSPSLTSSPSVSSSNAPSGALSTTPSVSLSNVPSAMPSVSPSISLSPSSFNSTS